MMAERHWDVEENVWIWAGGSNRIWGKLHNEGCSCLYSSPDIIRVIDVLGVACSTQGEIRNAYKMFVGNREVKRGHFYTRFRCSFSVFTSTSISLLACRISSLFFVVFIFRNK
jgi:hypothetical protein